MSSRIVYFYMKGCPHCNATWPTWNAAKGSLKKRGMTPEEKESREVGPADGVSSFPTFVIYKNGQEIKRIEGSQTDRNAFLSKLGVRGRSSARRRRTHRRGRKLSGRTLRNNVAFA